MLLWWMSHKTYSKRKTNLDGERARLESDAYQVSAWYLVQLQCLPPTQANHEGMDIPDGSIVSKWG